MPIIQNAKQIYERYPLTLYKNRESNSILLINVTKTKAKCFPFSVKRIILHLNA